MRKVKVCYSLNAETLAQLRATSEKTGIPQSRIVERALAAYLEYLEKAGNG